MLLNLSLCPVEREQLAKAFQTQLPPGGFNTLHQDQLLQCWGKVFLAVTNHGGCEHPQCKGADDF